MEPLSFPHGLDAETNWLLRIYPLDPSMVGGGVLYPRHVSPSHSKGASNTVDGPKIPSHGALGKYGSILATIQKMG